MHASNARKVYFKIWKKNKTVLFCIWVSFTSQLYAAIADTWTLYIDVLYTENFFSRKTLKLSGLSVNLFFIFHFI